MWKANGNTTALLLFLDSLFPKTEIHMRDASSGDKTEKLGEQKCVLIFLQSFSEKFSF
jgi:hypothetical protein